MKLDAAPALRPGRRTAVAILAPHLSTPLRNGADVYVWNKYVALDPTLWDARLITADGIYTLSDFGSWEMIRRVRPTHRSRVGALATMLTRGLDYLSAKFSTPAYLALCSEVALKNFDLVVCSYTSTVRIARDAGLDPARLMIDTHNFDPKVYLDRALELRGPRRLLAGLAAIRAHGLLRTVPTSTPLVALGASDCDLYRALGFTRVTQGRLGFEKRRPRAHFPTGEEPRLLFVGSLSMTMNEMALRAFVAGPLRELRRRLGRPLWFGVAGSRPSRSLVEFLKAAGVSVEADLADGELSYLLESCHATVLPFTSTNGLKLKFAHSASHGVPILSFIDPPEGLEQAAGVLVSSDMGAWAEWLDRLSTRLDLSRRWSAELQAASARNAWSVIVADEMAALPQRRRTARVDARMVTR